MKDWWLCARLRTPLSGQVYLLISSFLLVFAFWGVIRITKTYEDLEEICKKIRNIIIMKEMRIYNDVTNVFKVCITPSYVVDISDVTLVVLAKSYCFLCAVKIV